MRSKNLKSIDTKPQVEILHGLNPVQPRLKAVDFFCGAGGVTRGFTDSGIQVLAGIDIDINCEETYKTNNPGAEFLKRDISNYQPEDLMADLKIQPNDDQLVFVGCSPCQYYSSVNNVKDKSAKGKLLLEDFQRFVSFFRPAYIFIENVPGLKNNPESPLGQFQQLLRNLGYAFSEKVVNAKYLGVPQNRRRYILLATRLREEMWLPIENKLDITTLRSAIGNTELFPPIEAGYSDPTDFLHSTASLADINLRRLRKTPHNGGSRTAWANDPELQAECYKKHDGHTDVYGRLFWDRPAPTITTKFHSLSNGRYGHPEQDRALSLREGAVLQSFPSDYKFKAASQGLNARLIGNAVPPKMAEQIGLTIIKHNRNGAIQN